MKIGSKSGRITNSRKMKHRRRKNCGGFGRGPSPVVAAAGLALALSSCRKYCSSANVIRSVSESSTDDARSLSTSFSSTSVTLSRGGQRIHTVADQDTQILTRIYERAHTSLSQTGIVEVDGGNDGTGHYLHQQLRRTGVNRKLTPRTHTDGADVRKKAREGSPDDYEKGQLSVQNYKILRAGGIGGSDPRGGAFNHWSGGWNSNDDDDTFHWDDDDDSWSHAGGSKTGKSNKSGKSSKSGKLSKSSKSTLKGNWWGSTKVPIPPTRKPTGYPTDSPQSDLTKPPILGPSVGPIVSPSKPPFDRPTLIPSKIPHPSPGSASPTNAPANMITLSPSSLTRNPTTNNPETLPPVSALPTTSSPTSSLEPTSALPPLRWNGVNGCSPEVPCDACAGDCDTDEDCISHFECFARGDGETTQVPGCAIGGPGDIPGADYCYDPGSKSPTMNPTGTVSPSSPPTPLSKSPPPSPPSESSQPTVAPLESSSPTVTPIFSPSKKPTVDETKSPSQINPLPPLVWKGIDGCTPMSPCDICAGDCDLNQDCLDNFRCFKRADGETNQVPGCAVGGTGDIPGADYCYDPSVVIPTPAPVYEQSQSPTVFPMFETSSPSSPPQDGPSLMPMPSIPTSAPATLPSEQTPSPTVTSTQPTSSKSPASVAPTKTSLLPTMEDQEGFFLRSQSRPEVEGENGQSSSSRHRQLSTRDWCASGALSPDYYQLLLEACIPSSEILTHPVGQVEQIDQLWRMDEVGLIRSSFNNERCMAVQSGVDAMDEASIEISPCDVNNPLHKFYYDQRSDPSTLKLQGEQYDSYCVTFLGATASKGAPMILGRCDSGERFGWDFISEKVYGNPTAAPTEPFPQLTYEGRDACNENTPCGVCTGDCDGNSGCEPGLKCFQRGRDETSQVPGCSVGGPGDVPGSDYCYDPDAPLPNLVWFGKEACTPNEPCNRCTGECNGDDGCIGDLKCMVRQEGQSDPIPGCRNGGLGNVSGGSYCYNNDDVVAPTNAPTRSPTALPPLVWRGSNGCTSDNPCPPCVGDCDDDNECEPSLSCFQRLAGERTQVPGCAVGGLGDVPGGDYCYNPNSDEAEQPLSTAFSSTSSSRNRSKTKSGEHFLQMIRSDFTDDDIFPLYGSPIPMAGLSKNDNGD
mmetsp:Transcript_23744/g.49499  ORF Transcript_23744/g.49499 Transcript_23744/m.49499 type:complete len:1140 (-) Transcript_23744:263-3682(-)